MCVSLLHLSTQALARRPPRGSSEAAVVVLASPLAAAGQAAAGDPALEVLGVFGLFLAQVEAQDDIARQHCYQAKKPRQNHQARVRGASPDLAVGHPLVLRVLQEVPLGLEEDHRRLLWCAWLFCLGHVPQVGEAQAAGHGRADHLGLLGKHCLRQQVRTPGDLPVILDEMHLVEVVPLEDSPPGGCRCGPEHCHYMSIEGHWAHHGRAGRARLGNWAVMAA
mmetsp:Transcript_78679/g.177754  ORF Transcript_78679/g.177754 Transcript_78679/m.177754 type:complete len:222 (-) Transcript_78679:8-673(-)